MPYRDTPRDLDQFNFDPYGVFAADVDSPSFEILTWDVRPAPHWLCFLLGCTTFEGGIYGGHYNPDYQCRRCGEYPDSIHSVPFGITETIRCRVAEIVKRITPVHCNMCSAITGWGFRAPSCCSKQRCQDEWLKNIPF